MYPSSLTSSMRSLFEERQGKRSKEALEQLGIPASHSPHAVTYQDFLPPPPPSVPLPLPIENTDRQVLTQSAAEGNDMAKLAIAQLDKQSQQHVLTKEEREFMKNAWVKTLRGETQNAN